MSLKSQSCKTGMLALPMWQQKVMFVTGSSLLIDPVWSAAVQWEQRGLQPAAPADKMGYYPVWWRHHRHDSILQLLQSSHFCTCRSFEWKNTQCEQLQTADVCTLPEMLPCINLNFQPFSSADEPHSSETLTFSHRPTSDISHLKELRQTWMLSFPIVTCWCGYVYVINWPPFKSYIRCVGEKLLPVETAKCSRGSEADGHDPHPETLLCPYLSVNLPSDLCSCTDTHWNLLLLCLWISAKIINGFQWWSRWLHASHQSENGFWDISIVHANLLFEQWLICNSVGTLTFELLSGSYLWFRGSCFQKVSYLGLLQLFVIYNSENISFLFFRPSKWPRFTVDIWDFKSGCSQNKAHKYKVSNNAGKCNFWPQRNTEKSSLQLSSGSAHAATGWTTSGAQHKTCQLTRNYI